MATAEMFLLEPMRVQCETVLSGKLDIEVMCAVNDTHACTRAYTHANIIY